MLYSLCSFFNENDIFEIRLGELTGDRRRFPNRPALPVRKHVVVEANQTHSGKPKPLNFDHGRFEPWADSIIYKAIDLKEDSDWGREKEQRRAAWDVLNGAVAVNESDTILLSDLDEIPNSWALERAAWGGVSQSLPCRMHVGRLNYRWKAEAHHSHSICRVFKARLAMRDSYPRHPRSPLAAEAGAASGRPQRDLEEIRLAPFDFGAQELPPGWHLSWAQGIGTKLAAFCHQEMVPFARPDLALKGGPLFPLLIQQEVEWFDPEEPGALPSYVINNRERFEHLLAEKP